MPNPTMPGGSRRPRRAALRAMVVKCARVDGVQDQTWTGRKRLLLTLSCGHQIVRVSFERFQVGERVRCKPCEAACEHQEPLFPLGVTEA